VKRRSTEQVDCPLGPPRKESSPIAVIAAEADFSDTQLNVSSALVAAA
jgi:hypothetical protein